MDDKEKVIKIYCIILSLIDYTHWYFDEKSCFVTYFHGEMTGKNPQSKLYRTDLLNKMEKTIGSYLDI